MTTRMSPRPSSGSANAGSAPALDVFALRDSVVDEYKRFATSFTTIHAPDIREQVDAIYAESRYWPEPLIRINPSYKRTSDVGSLVAGGVLHPRCAEILRADGEPLSLYKHQEQATQPSVGDGNYGKGIGLAGSSQQTGARLPTVGLKT